LCGNLGHPRKGCRCSPEEVRRYRARVSGPLLDRIDIQLEVPPVQAKELGVDVSDRRSDENGSTSVAAARRVVAARARQLARTKVVGRAEVLNARLTPRQLEAAAPLDPRGRSLLAAAIERLGLSARAYHRIWRLARTLADLEDSESVSPTHITEAITFRALDRA
jgi:magnesium chelatase family protein